jgi:serine/threonine-protein kinase RsbW
MNSISPNLRLRILSDPANLAEARKAVEGLAKQFGFEQLACDDLGLCVNEAMANIIRHAYNGATDKPIDLSADLEGDTLRIRLRDWGNGVDPRVAPKTNYDPFTPGGLGLICLERMMNNVRFVPQQDGMLLEMTRKK